MSDFLVEIPRDRWAALRDQYNEKRTESSAYNMLDNFVRWAADCPERTDVKIYALDGAIREDGTFVVIDNISPEMTTEIYANTLNDNFKSLVRALNCLDLKESQLFCAIPQRLLPAVRDHFDHAGCGREVFKPDCTFWYHIAREKVEQFTVDPPPGITLKSLEGRHAEQVNSIWPHRSPGSVTFVERLIQYNNSVGAFDAACNLVAWCLWLPTGALGLLQVEASHRRRGLGGLVVRHMAKQMAAKNIEIMAPVITENMASRALFGKLGFEIINETYWIMRDVKDVKTEKSNS